MKKAITFIEKVGERKSDDEEVFAALVASELRHIKNDHLKRRAK